MSGTSLLSLPVELLLEIGKITDLLPSPPSFQKPAPPASPSLFQLPPMLTPGSAPFTPLGRIADTGTASGGDYFGNLGGGGVGGFVLGNGGDQGMNGRRGSVLESNNLLHPQDRRGSEQLLAVGPFGSRRSSLAASSHPSIHEEPKANSRAGTETLRNLSEVSKELRERLWPLLLGTITLNLQKVKDILGSPAKDAFAQTVRHLQIDLYPNDPTFLEDVSAFLRIVHTHLYSLQFRFHPLPRPSVFNSKGKGKQKDGPAAPSDPTANDIRFDHAGEPAVGTVEPRRKVFHLPSIGAHQSTSKMEREPALPELQTLRLKGFGFTSSLEANILRQAPNLSTLDIACQPVPLSRAYDINESLKMHCPLMEILRLEVDLGMTAMPYVATSDERRTELGRELWSFVKQTFLPTNGNGNTPQNSSSAEARPGSLRRLRSVDLLCKDFAACVDFEEWGALAKVIVENAPLLQTLQLPVNPGLQLLSDTEYSNDFIEEHRQTEQQILGSLLALGEPNSRDIGINSNEPLPPTTTDASGSRAAGDQHTSTRTFSVQSSPASRLEHLEHLELKLGSERKQTIIDPLIHPDDHPFHSRILPPEQKVAEDPGRIGRFVASGRAAAPRQSSAEGNEAILGSRGGEPNVAAATWRWESSGKLLECEHYTVWSACVERRLCPSPRGTTVETADLRDTDMDRAHASVRHGEGVREAIRVVARQSAHHRW